MATSANEPRWPPRSPHEALLSSPSGRNKLRRYTDRTSPSPSPLKKSATTPNLGRIRRGPRPATATEDEDEEDEETLQLRLDAIEARLKLKKLQQKKKTKTASSSSDIENERPAELNHRASSILEARQCHQLEGPRSKSFSGIQIPVSPSHKPKSVDEPKSPGRVLLGIDKGLKGRNVSLKRPPVSRNQQPAEDDPFLNHRTTTSESKLTVPSNSTGSSYRNSPVKSKSFSERIAETRQLEKEQKERAYRIRNRRSTGFGIKDDEIETFKNEAENQDTKDDQRVSSRGDGFSREEVLKAVNKPNGRLARHNTVSTTSSLRPPQYEKPFSPVNPKQALDSSKTPKPTELSPQPSRSSQSEKQPDDTTLYDPFSTLHLTKRIHPHPMLTKTFGSKPILLLPSLLRQVHSPTYTLPAEYDTDFIVLAAIASKSSPLSHKDTHRTNTTDTTPATPDPGAADAYACAVLLPSVVGRIRADAPGVDVRITPDVADIAEALDTGRVDLAISGYSRVPERLGLRELLRDRLVWVLRADHPLAEEPLTLERLASLPHLVRALADERTEAMDGMVVEHGLERRVAQGGDGALIDALAGIGRQRQVRLTIVGETVLAALVPWRMAAAWAGHYRLIWMEPPYPGPEAQLSMVWHLGLGSNLALKWLRDTIAEVAGRV